MWFSNRFFVVYTSSRYVSKMMLNSLNKQFVGSTALLWAGGGGVKSWTLITSSVVTAIARQILACN